MDLLKLRHIVEFVDNLDLGDPEQGKFKISLGTESAVLGNIPDTELLGKIMSTKQGQETLRQLANDPNLSHDIVAIAKKREALNEFKEKLEQDDLSEKSWQNFFEQNEWIFGYGLRYEFLSKADKKLETTTTGSSHEQDGKRIDALMKVNAEISQYVLIEIKKSSENLLHNKEDETSRPGCYRVSNVLSGAVTQIQKTVFEFVNNKFHKKELKDEKGNSTGEMVYRIQPKSYLIIGNLKQLKKNDDKIICFELYRKSLTSPEIITYDELYERAKCIVETLSNNTQEYT